VLGVVGMILVFMGRW